ncbi:MAG: TIGR03086 family protein [Microthrixaceae bacterium]|nr:TIGR03086 family protein [Microthrixaceae bacterium]
MNPDVLAQSQQVAADVLARVTAEQLSLATPCEKWNVGQIIDHLIGAQHWARCGMTGAEMTETGDGSSAGDFQSDFAAAAAASLAAFGEDGALERTVNAGFGDMPATALLGMATTDTFTHAWDIATATGQSNDLAPELAAQLLAGARQTIQPGFRSEDGSIFKAEQPVPEGANAATQLAAFLGRTV